MASFDPALLTRSIVERDGAALGCLAEDAPNQTLHHLDGAMRGLRDGPIPPEQVAWLEEQERLIRRRLGWKQRTADIFNLQTAYQTGNLFLVVGAGISQGAGLPGWKDLVLDMLVRALDHGTPEHRRRTEANLRRAFSNLPDAIADQEIRREMKRLRPASPELRTRIRAIHDELSGMENYTTDVLLRASQSMCERFSPDEFLGQLQQALFNRQLTRNKAHAAIARMVHPAPQDPGPRTPRVFAIVTYNFDDMIEQALREEGLGFTVHCSQRGQHVQHHGDTRGRGSAVDIFHVHGIAPGGWIVDLSGIDLVFTEAQYDVQYARKDGLALTVQRSSFTHAPGLIIGSSLTDEFAVEQLAAAHQAQPGWHHYAVMKLPESLRSRGEELTGETLDEISAPYRRMGLRIIWMRKHDEIPDILNAISRGWAWGQDGAENQGHCGAGERQ